MDLLSKSPCHCFALMSFTDPAIQRKSCREKSCTTGRKEERRKTKAHGGSPRTLVALAHPPLQSADVARDSAPVAPATMTNAEIATRRNREAHQ